MLRSPRSKSISKVAEESVTMHVQTLNGCTVRKSGSWRSSRGSALNSGRKRARTLEISRGCMRNGRKLKRSAMLCVSKGTGAKETKIRLWNSLRWSALNSEKRNSNSRERYRSGKSRSSAAKSSARLHVLGWKNCGRKRRGL